MHYPSDVTLKSLETSIQTLAIETPTSSKKSHSLGKKADKDKTKDSTKEARFGLFKRSSNHSSSSQPSEFGVDAVANDGLVEPLPPSFHRVQLALETLKAQHAMLLTSMQMLAEMSHSNQGSPLSATVEEEAQPSRLDTSPRISTPVSKLSRRTSIATSGSESMHEWYDALDGAEEFFMDAPNPEEQTSTMLMNESRSSLYQQDSSSIDTDIEDHGGIKELRPSTPTSSRIADPKVKRRTHLPSPPVGDEGSLFAMLKKNVGKDLSTITFPVTFNEPLTLLQRAAEEVEYYSVLDDAALADNPVERMCHVAAFAVSSYAHTRHRTGRKAFNPMLGETFEDPRMKFIAEKVRHNPLEMAYHAQGKLWQLNATSSGRTKFWEFKQNGYWGPSNVVSGIVYGPSGEVVMHLEGKWDDQMTQTLDSSNFRILWRSTPFPKNTHEFYGFTYFGITLNELTDDLVGKIPPTDSRFRPDVRALEDGHVDIAEEQKVRVEEMQRERRKQGKDRRARWFYQDGDEWTYAGGYWEARERGWEGEVIQSLW
ncbi:hypothetical protein H0H87_010999 [Tephrocybe sp. NHM501043]|nr:hypothetical protein H0H87_010999 [Tephrocybe sp. NHM501043]